MTTSGKPIYVLGTGLSHDGSACLLRDGRIRVAIEKERITRLKHDGSNDDAAIRYCLDAEGIRLEDVSVVVQNANFSMFQRGNAWFRGSRMVAAHPRVVSISHHLAHAYSAIGTSPFAEAAVLVIDGCGNAYDESVDREGATIPLVPPPGSEHLYFEKDSYYSFAGALKPVFKDYSQWGYQFRELPLCPPTTMHSIGGMYSAASHYCLFGMDDPGKLMGLAPHGRPGVHRDEIFRLEDGRVFVEYDWMSKFDRPCRSFSAFKESFQYYADIAHWVQREVERAVLYVANHRYQMAPSPDLVYAGGVALNVVANARLLRETKFRRLYVQPAAGDNGLAIGCAYYGWLSVLGEERVRHDGSTFLGRSYSIGEIDQAIEPVADRLERVETDDVVATTAELLAAGQKVGWFQGGAEFGPRALGHRSILADPRSPDVRDFINEKIKLREDYRPFAPSVPLDDAPRYFDCEHESPYMLLVAPVRPEVRDQIPSVVHRNGSCRIQTVTPEAEPRFHALLRAFERRTGVSVLLNTSFNRRAMPIVEHPKEAVDLFLTSALDVLVIEDRIWRKRPGAAQEPQMDVARFLCETFKESLLRNRDEVKAMRGVFLIRIDTVRGFTVDLTKSEPLVFEGSPPNPDVTVELDEADFKLFAANPTGTAIALFEQGKLKVQGDFARAAMLSRLFEMR